MAKLTVEFFTEHEGLLDFPPQLAKKNSPAWFKAMQPTHEIPPSQHRFPFGLSEKLRISNVNGTIKRCPGIVSYLSEGYIIPLWSDFLVQVRNNQIYCVGSNQAAHITPHNKAAQYNTMPVDDSYVPDAIKFTNPWKIKTPKGYSVLVTSPFYHFDNRFVVTPGVIDSDSYHHIHVITFFKKGDADYQLKLGSPFLHVIPFKRETLDTQVRKMTTADKKMMERLDFRGNRFFNKNATIKS